MFERLKKKLKSWAGKSQKQSEESEKHGSKKTEEKTKKPDKTGKKEKSEERERKQAQLEGSEKPEEKKGFLTKFVSKLSSKKLEQKQIQNLLEPLEFILLENNVALEVVDRIKEKVTKDLIGTEIKKSSLEEKIKNSLKEAISSVLQEPYDLVEKIKEKQGVFTIVFFGINGSGKTTSLAKLASFLEKRNISCVLGAADTFRAASIEQLEKHAENLKIKVIKQPYGSDPTAVAFDTKKYAEKNRIKCAIIDTAGRMYTKENLIKEMEKLTRVIRPDFKVFVGESITGNDATEQAKTFNQALGIDGIILSKADVDEKGGAALSVSYVTGKPILFLGTGQEYRDLKPFKKLEILKNLGLD